MLPPAIELRDFSGMLMILLTAASPSTTTWSSRLNVGHYTFPEKQLGIFAWPSLDQINAMKGFSSRVYQ